METTTDLLDKYKRQPFAAGLIPFQAALPALGTPFSRIYTAEAGRQRWVVSVRCNVGLQHLMAIGLDFRQEDDGTGYVQLRRDIFVVRRLRYRQLRTYRSRSPGWPRGQGHVSGYHAAANSLCNMCIQPKAGEFKVPVHVHIRHLYGHQSVRRPVGKCVIRAHAGDQHILTYCMRRRWTNTWAR